MHLSPAKLTAARAFSAAFKPGMRVCLTTHVNPDGDGLGSEAGLAHLLHRSAELITRGTWCAANGQRFGRPPGRA